MKNLVAVKKIKDPRKIGEYLSFILEKIKWTKLIKGKTIFIKINAMSAELVPGRNTGPWVLEPFLKILKKRFPKHKVYMGDTDLAGSRQLRPAIRNWGYDKLSKKYNVPIININQAELVEVNMRGKILHKMLLPKILVQASTIINMPVLKTHCLTGMTCCLKNLWGLLPRARHNYHPHVHEVIADINSYFKNCTLNLVDASIAMEGTGPKIGTPKISNVIFAGSDRVACDAYARDLIGLDQGEIPYIKYAEKKGVGSSQYKILGDKVGNLHFKKSLMKNDFASFVEMSLRRFPFFRKFLFESPLVYLAGYLGTKYNYYFSYLFKGQKKLAEKIIYHSPYSYYLRKIYEN